MAVSPEYRDYVQELLAPLGPVSIRRMFGGAGVFYDEVMFALIAGETLYLKVDDETRPDFEAAGQGPFTYQRSEGPRALQSYYRLPDELLDETDELLVWARRAVDAALRAQAAKPRKDRRKRRRKG